MYHHRHRKLFKGQFTGMHVLVIHLMLINKEIMLNLVFRNELDYRFMSNFMSFNDK